MSGDQGIKIRVKRETKKSSGFVVEQGDDGYFYLSKIPAHCTDASVDNRVLEINGTRWTDFEDEDHAQILLDDPKQKFVQMSIAAKGADSDDDDVDEESSVDEEFSAASSDSGDDVSIDTDSDVDDVSRMDSVINRGAPSVADRPNGQRKMVFNDDSSEEYLDIEDENDNEEHYATATTSKTRRQADVVNVSDASDEDSDEEAHDYSQENRSYDKQSGKRQDDASDASSEESALEEEDSGYKQNARKEADDRIAIRKQKQREAQEKAEKAKVTERERARAIKKRKEEEQQREAAERKRKDDLARQRKEAEAEGTKKPVRCTVKVEKNIGQYVLGSPPGKSPSKVSGSGGWSKVTSPKITSPKLISPKPSPGGWNKVKANHKTNG